MAIKESEFSKKLNAYSRVIARLKEISQIENLPLELKNEIVSFQEKIEAYDIDRHKDKLIKPKGDILTLEEVKSIMLDATGYTKWKHFSHEEEYGEIQDHSWMAKSFGIEITADKIQSYNFNRDAKSRDDLSMLQFVCVPGHVYVSFDTGRANWDSRGLVANKDLGAFLEKECG